MINTWIALPFGLRVAFLALLGIVLGAVGNFAIYNFAWFKRPIGPWSKPDPNAPERRVSDRIPILGWIGLKRESQIHGAGFWVRPMLIEVAMLFAVPVYYWYVTQSGSLLPIEFRDARIIGLAEPWLTTVFASHVVMITIMVAATFIDFDEQTIPDLLTIPGTIFALIVASVSVRVFLPVLGPNGPMPTIFVSPVAVDPKWLGPTGWWTGIGIWTMWCFALSNRRVILRRGVTKAIEFFFASLVRYPGWKVLLAIWILGAIAIRAMFSVGGVHWIGLLSALVGLGVGGGVVWTIRIVGSLAMRREALGFGDVTLMAMVGAFIGWQGAVMSFFVAPIAAIIIVLVYYIITRNSEIPFGPYLCAGTLLTVIWWDRLVAGWFIGNFADFGTIHALDVYRVGGYDGGDAVLLANREGVVSWK